MHIVKNTIFTVTFTIIILTHNQSNSIIFTTERKSHCYKSHHSTTVSHERKNYQIVDHGKLVHLFIKGMFMQALCHES